MPVIGDDIAIVFTFLSSLKPFEGIILNRDFHVPVRDQQVKIILMGFCQSWWYISTWNVYKYCTDNKYIFLNQLFCLFTSIHYKILQF